MTTVTRTVAWCKNTAAPRPDRPYNEYVRRTVWVVLDGEHIVGGRTYRTEAEARAAADAIEGSRP